MNDIDHHNLDLETCCACGRVGLTLTGTIKSMFLCSCLDCQKATGTGHSAVMVMPAKSLAVSGAVKSFGRVADSGATFTHSFCPECGTPLFGRSSRAPDLVMIPAGLLGEQAGRFSPRHMIFARSHWEWDAVPPDLPLHDTYGRGRDRHERQG
jgi:hypothetical protein